MDHTVFDFPFFIADLDPVIEVVALEEPGPLLGGLFDPFRPLGQSQG